MADKTIGSVLYSTDGSRLDYDTAANLDATFRDVSAQADAAMTEARRTRWTATRDHTIIFAVEAAGDVTVDESRRTLTFQIGA